MLIGFHGELETAIFIENDLYELLIIKLIYLNVAGVADKRRAKANHAAMIGAWLVGMKVAKLHT